MNLFESIGLTADPFSTSPSIELFYDASRHKQCLEGLELAIRMRRGLSVVRGGIGVGKTTLSRKLIENFKSETDVFEFHLMLDPKFESELELLGHIIELFGIDNTGDSVQENRNIIENHLLKVGVDDGKILSLIVDEGQNMPENMLDVFRTLLNFEANDYKLLQLIIFGQPEMGSMIKKYPNFEDRISFDFELGPLSLKDTTGFIHYRMKQVSNDEKEWFSQQVIKKIYKKTSGYPRKITQVCHELLLSLLDTDIRVVDLDNYNQVFNKTIDIEEEIEPEKKEYSSIAVNKLLDVLRKESIDNEENLTDEQDSDDDWIGNPEDVKLESVNDINESKQNINQSNNIPDSNGKDTIDEKTNEESVPVEKEIANPENPKYVSDPDDQDIIGQKTNEESQDISVEKINDEIPITDHINKEPDTQVSLESIPNKDKIDSRFNQLPNPGENLSGNKVLSLIEQKYMHGFSVDNGKLRSIILINKGGKKKLLSAHRLNSPSPDIHPLKEPNEFGLIISQFFDDLSLKLTGLKELSSKILSLLKDRNSLSISISGISLYSRVIKIAKDNSSKPEEIVEWAMKTNQPFESNSLKISNFTKQPNSTLIAAASDGNQLENYGDLFRGMDWIVNRWMPESISLFNAFKWNYPDYSTHASIIFHLGESHSFILACKGNCLLQIEPVHIGIKNLYETIKDQNSRIKGWFDRSDYQIPAVLLSEFGIKQDNGLFDNEFRPVIDTWRQAFNRCLNSIKKNNPLDENTRLLLSGSLSEIAYSSKYFESAFGFSCELLNPFRNLELPQDNSFLNADIHPSLFTIAVGNALSFANKVTLLPSFYEENEKFRFLNKIITPAVSVIMIFFLSFSGYKYSNYVELNNKIPTISASNKAKDNVRELFYTNIKTRKLIDEQVEKMSYDIDFTNRVTEILKYISNITDKDIFILNARFHYGWEEVKTRMRKGQRMELKKSMDENQRFVTIKGQLMSNPALQEQYLASFQKKLNESGLFYNIKTVDVHGDISSGEKMIFTLRCEF